MEQFLRPRRISIRFLDGLVILCWIQRVFWFFFSTAPLIFNFLIFFSYFHFFPIHFFPFFLSFAVFSFFSSIFFLLFSHFCLILSFFLLFPLLFSSYLFSCTCLSFNSIFLILFAHFLDHYNYRSRNTLILLGWCAKKRLKLMEKIKKMNIAVNASSTAKIQVADLTVSDGHGTPQALSTWLSNQFP